MKIIDLLNKIANGEEVPKKIKFNNEIFNFKNDIHNYSTVRDGKNVTLDSYLLIYSINEEIEIIEEDLTKISVEKLEENIEKLNNIFPTIEDVIDNLNRLCKSLEDYIYERDK